METFEIAETLLADKSLRLHIELSYRFSGETFRVDDLSPISDSEFLECKL